MSLWTRIACAAVTVVALGPTVTSATAQQPELFDNALYAIALASESALRKPLNKELVGMPEDGTIDVLAERLFGPSP